MDGDKETQDLIAQVTEFLEEKMRGRELVCPVCGQKEWALGNMLGQILQFKKMGLNLAGPLYPLAALFCATCGYVRFFNLVVMGLLPAGPIPIPAHPPEEEKKG